MGTQQSFERQIADLCQEYEDATGYAVRRVEVIPLSGGGYKVRLVHGRNIRMSEEREDKRKWPIFEEG